MSGIRLVLASDNVELPVDSLAKRFEYDIDDPEQKPIKVFVKFRGITYVKAINYNVYGNIDNTFSDDDNESEWCKVAI